MTHQGGPTATNGSVSAVMAPPTSRGRRRPAWSDHHPPRGDPRNTAAVPRASTSPMPADERPSRSARSSGSSGSSMASTSARRMSARPPARAPGDRATPRSPCSTEGGVGDRRAVSGISATAAASSRGTTEMRRNVSRTPMASISTPESRGPSSPTPPPAVSASPSRKPSWSTGYTSLTAARAPVHVSAAAPPCTARAMARVMGSVVNANATPDAKSSRAPAVSAVRRPARSTHRGSRSAVMSCAIGKAANNRATWVSEMPISRW